MSLTFRWLGAAGVELRAGNQVLALDPFFTRPSLIKLLRPIKPNPSLVAEILPTCNTVLVTHSHYDHLLDVPEVLRQTGAAAYGSRNTCRLLHLLGVAADLLNEVHWGDTLSLGAFKVEVIKGQHSSIPFDQIFNGELRPKLRPPLYAYDYRMDVCLGYHIMVMDAHLMVCAAEPQPADILLAGAQEVQNYYARLLKGVQPHTFVPIHWDNFTRPLSKPLHRFTRPGALPLWQIAQLARIAQPDINVIIPEIFREYTLLG